MAEMYQEMKERDGQLLRYQEQNKRLQELNSGLNEQLQSLPDTEEMLSVMEKQDYRITQLKTENQRLTELAGRLNSENALLQQQNLQLLRLNNS
jgi:hypothetical protein